jgi:nitroreductase
MTQSAAEVNSLKHAPPVDKVLPIFLQRWSPRSFADREVSTADLETIFQAVRWTASSYNEQPWRFLIGKRNTDTHQKIFASLVEFNQKWARTAPILILGVSNTKFSHNGTPNGSALYDLGAAAAVLCLEAASLGIATHQMAGFDKEGVRKSLGVPEDFAVGAVIALGYQGEPTALSDPQMLSQETAPRQRKSLKEFVLEAWDQPLNLS